MSWWVGVFLFLLGALIAIGLAAAVILALVVRRAFAQMRTLRDDSARALRFAREKLGDEARDTGMKPRA